MDFRKHWKNTASLAVIAALAIGGVIAQASDVSIGVNEGNGTNAGGVACTGLAAASAKCAKVTMIDAAGNDAVGAGATGVSQPTGGSGILGWLSGAYNKLSAIATSLAGTLTTKPVDSGGGDATDTTNHAIKVNAPNSYNILNAQSTLTLPSTTTAYGAGSLIGSSATAGSVVIPSFAIANAAGGAVIPRLRLSTNDATSTAWGGVQIQVDLWTAAPTFTNGDRGAFSPATGTANHLGSYTCTMSAEYGDGAYAECAPSVGSFAVPKLASGTNVYWTLQAVTASGVTGASKVWTLTAEEEN